MKREITVHVLCRWDAEARVWWAESEDLLGLATEAASIPDLIQRVMEVAPDLVKENMESGKEEGEILLNLVPTYQQSVRINAH